MELHLNNLEFEELIELTSQKINIPSSAVRKDYFITIILKKLSDSDFIDRVVFKGQMLSKINRAIFGRYRFNLYP